MAGLHGTRCTVVGFDRDEERKGERKGREERYKILLLNRQRMTDNSLGSVGERLFGETFISYIIVETSNRGGSDLGYDEFDEFDSFRVFLSKQQVADYGNSYRNNNSLASRFYILFYFNLYFNFLLRLRSDV